MHVFTFTLLYNSIYFIKISLTDPKPLNWPKPELWEVLCLSSSLWLRPCPAGGICCWTWLPHTTAASCPSLRSVCDRWVSGSRWTERAFTTAAHGEFRTTRSLLESGQLLSQFSLHTVTHQPCVSFHEFIFSSSILPLCVHTQYNPLHIPLIPPVYTNIY